MPTQEAPRPQQRSSAEPGRPQKSRSPLPEGTQPQQHQGMLEPAASRRRTTAQGAAARPLTLKAAMPEQEAPRLQQRSSVEPGRPQESRSPLQEGTQSRQPQGALEPAASHRRTTAQGAAARPLTLKAAMPEQEAPRLQQRSSVEPGRPQESRSPLPEGTQSRQPQGVLEPAASHRRTTAQGAAARPLALKAAMPEQEAPRLQQRSSVEPGRPQESRSPLPEGTQSRQPQGVLEPAASHRRTTAQGAAAQPRALKAAMPEQEAPPPQQHWLPAPPPGELAASAERSLDAFPTKWSPRVEPEE